MFNLLFALLLSKLGFSQSPLQEQFVLPNSLAEVSGMALDKDGNLWMINDSGNPSEVWIKPVDSDSIYSIPVKAKNVDWEALTFDENGNLLIADIGNNCNCRRDLGIYKIEKPSIKADTLYTQFFSFLYPEQSEFPASEKSRDFDAEALIAFKGNWYVFTKCRREPYDGISLVYQLDPKIRKQSAVLVDSLIFPADRMEESWISDAALSEDGKLALLGYENLHVISHFNRNIFSSGMIQKLDFYQFSQTEGVVFKNDSTLLISNEIRPPFDGGKLYTCDLTDLIHSSDKLIRLEVHLVRKVVQDYIELDLELEREAPVYFEIINQDGNRIKGGKIGDFERGNSKISIPSHDLINAQYILNVVVGIKPHAFFVTVQRELNPVGK